MSYDKDSIRIKFDQESDVEQVRRYGVLEKLNSIMSGYGFHEDSHMFTILKYYLLSINPAGGEFYENFVLDVVKYPLCYAMKIINECIGQVNKFKPIFSPSMVYLLKSLNVLRRSLDVNMELTCIELISEKHGSLLGAMLSERHSLINNAAFNLNVYEMKMHHHRRYLLITILLMFIPRQINYKPWLLHLMYCSMCLKYYALNYTGKKETIFILRALCILKAGS